MAPTTGPGGPGATESEDGVERFTASCTVGARPEVLWDVLTDPARVHRWLTVAHGVRTEDPWGDGQRLLVQGGHLGVRRDVEVAVDVWDPPNRYGWALDDPLPVRFRFALAALDLADVDRGTRLDAHVDADLSGLPRLGTRVAVRSLRREFTWSIDTLARLATG